MSYFNIFKSTTNDEEQQQEQRPRTRSQTRSNLELPPSAISTFNGVARGRRTPSPRPVGHNANSAVVFAFDSTNLSQQLLQPQQQTDEEEFDNFTGETTTTTGMATTAAQIEELRAAAAAAVAAANAATQALSAAAGLVSSQQNSQQQQIRVRKPDLPEFDAKNVDIWIRRMQAAYDRAGIVLPKDKFAFLENKFAVGANPSIDSFLYGAATEENWSAFLEYLRSEYGRTVRQETQFLRGQHSRDGRRPSQMLSHIKERTKKVTLDDIHKEIILSSLPGEIQQMILERVKDSTAEQTAALADHYFDQDGKQLLSRAPTIQHVDSQQPQEPAEEESTDVNAIRGRRGNYRGNNRGGYNNSNNNNNNNRYTKPFSNNGSGGNTNNNSNSNRAEYNHRSRFNGATAGSNHSSTSGTARGASSSNRPTLCRNHERFGDQAYNCHESCPRWPSMPKRQSGNGNAGTRM